MSKHGKGVRGGTENMSGATSRKKILLTAVLSSVGTMHTHTLK